MDKKGTYDYSEIDAMVLEIIEKMSSYMKDTPKEIIQEEIWRAYIYSRDAHE